MLELLKISLTALILGFLVATLVVNVAVDDTDQDKDTRSGLVLYTDYSTGVQYVGGGIFGGGITPRLDADGNPVNIYNRR